MIEKQEEITLLESHWNQFDKHKNEILLNIKDGIDKSPKGSIDKPIKELVSIINLNDNYVTTSSCSGRISIFLDENHTKGIKWLFVKHNQVKLDDVVTTLNNNTDISNLSTISLKCEPLILHIECRTIESSRYLLKLALDIGCRESGITFGNKRTILAIRTTAYSLEIPLIINNKRIVDNDSLVMIVNEVNKRLAQNFCRIQKLIKILKIQWFYPHLQLSEDLPKIMNINRWGHSCAPNQYYSDNKIVIGGYGESINSNLLKNNSSSNRKIKSLLLTKVDKIYEINETFIAIETMHSASVNISFGTLIVTIVSGGRKSPTDPLPIILSCYNNNTLESMEFNLLGDIPSNRWGHTLTAFNNSYAICFGGRDIDSIYNDLFLLSFTIINNTIQIKFERIDVQIPIPSLFFHASCNMEIFYKDLESEEVVIIHGGLTSLNDFTCSNELFCIYPFRKTAEFINTSDIHTIYRYGHTITNIGYHTILLIGGTYFNDKNKTIENEEPSTILFDIFPVYNSSIEFYIQLNYNLRKLTNLDSFPCEYCRCHHVTIYDEKSSKILLLGGGSLCLGFGSHYCQSDQWSISLGITSNNKIDKKLDNMIDSNLEKITNSRDTYIKSKYDSVDKNEDSILIEKLFVKTIKTLLENYKYFDNKRRIVKHNFNDFYNLENYSSINISNDVSSDYTNYINELKNNNKDIYSIPVTIEFIKLRNNQQNNNEIFNKINKIINCNVIIIYNKHTNSSKLELFDYNIKYYNYFNDISKYYNLSINSFHNIPEKYEIIGNILMIPENNLNTNEWINLLDNNNIFDNLIKINKLINRIARKGKINTNGKRESNVKILYPINILNNYDYLPKKLFKLLQNECKFILKLYDKIDSEENDDVANIHQDLSNDGNIENVLADFKETDNVNEITINIHDILLNSLLNWVEIKENNIYYYFDITKVMFCSGNITERIRMSTIDMSNEIIIDLYCGIGYYTLPFLIYGKVKHIYCCEWNINSIHALYMNLLLNNINSELYTILYGNNRNTITHLPNKADRICLGLLPSSENGWKLACYCLKITGGYLHIHENVLESNITEWIIYCIDKLKLLFLKYNKIMNIQCHHIEKVKSYAPRVIHIVVDLECRPLNEVSL